jgi:hypothetical protein
MTEERRVNIIEGCEEGCIDKIQAKDRLKYALQDISDRLSLAIRSAVTKEKEKESE